MANRFVTRDTTRLELTDGDWIDVRLRLSFGEEQRLAGAMLGGMKHFDTDAELAFDMERGAVERIAVWVTGWSLTDEKGQAVALTRDAIKALDPDTAKEIQDALDTHVEAMEASKKAPNGVPMHVVKSA